jgi:4-hydroxybenzoyl-CoA thioesterase
VTLGLSVAQLGSRSITLSLRCFEPTSGELRMQVRQVLVTTSLDTHRAIAVPDDMRAAILRDAPALAAAEV